MLRMQAGATYGLSISIQMVLSASGRVFATPAAGKPGGLKTDEAGRVWVALGAAGIAIFSHEGKPFGSVSIPGQANNLNWGEGFRNLFVTTESSLYRVEARTNGTRTY